MFRRIKFFRQDTEHNCSFTDTTAQFILDVDKTVKLQEKVLDEAFGTHYIYDHQVLVQQVYKRGALHI